MAKGNNTGKTKRSHSYKPYDASNSSFVKRFTSRVTEILPGPSWISRWLTPTQVNIREDRDDEDEEEDEEERQSPPGKRMRLQTSVNDYTHQNHVKRRSDLQDEPEELSPISKIVDHQDDAVAGPSGLQLRRSNFISSTPATTQTTTPVINKHNSRDDGSDSSESTSGCSSLVPQAERTSTSTALPKLSAETHKIHSPGAVRRLSTSKDKYSTMNLSASQSRPSFDTYIFHNPHNKSLNSSRSSQLDEAPSPFYKGRTMYGGASACRDTLNMSVMSPVVKPKITNVKPVSRQYPERDTIGSSALRILRALEQISTPVTEAKKMPINELPRRRKPIQPFEELMIPQMPALLRIKRKRLNESITSTVDSKDATDASTSSLVNSRNDQSCSSFLPTSPSEKTTTHQTLPSYSLRKEETYKNDKFVTSIKGRSNEILENERLQEVKLPNVKLDITTLPKFSLPQIKSITRIPSNASDSHRTSLSATNIQTSRTTSTLFKFSDPIVESNDGHKIISIKPSIKFSKPLEADIPKQGNDLQNYNKTSKEDGSFSSILNQDSPRIDMIMKSSTSVPKLKRKVSQEDKTNSHSIQPSTNLQSASVMDFFKKNNSGDTLKAKSSQGSSPNVEGNNISKSKTNTNKMSSLESRSSEHKWSCNSCLSENNNSDNNCIKCGVSKIKDNNYSSKPKEEVVSSDSTKCKTCSSSYKVSDKKCTNCTAEKSDAATGNTNVSSTTSSLIPLSALFKKSAGSWVCDVCMVSNKAESDSCVSCSSPKPGAAPKPDAKSSFQFGIPSSSGTTNAVGFKFGIDKSINENKNNTTSNVALGGFKFGNDSGNGKSSTQEFKFGSSLPTSSTNTSESKVTFSFGHSNQEADKKEEKEQAEPKASASKLFLFGNVSSNDKTNEAKEEPKKDAQPPKKVTFSQQLVEEKTISSESISTVPSSSASFNFSSSSTNTTKSDQNTNAFSFTSNKNVLFGNINVSSSTSENPVDSNSLFKFGNSATTTTTTSSTTITSSDNPVTVSSSLATSDNDKASSTFSFLSNATSKPAFPSSETDNKKDAIIFGGYPTSNKPSQFNTTLAAPSTHFSFVSSNTDKSNSEKDTKKEGLPNNIFGEKRDSEPASLFNLQPQNEEKPTFFGTPKSESKPLFFPPNTNENFFSNPKADDWKPPKPSFGTDSFEPKTCAATSSAATSSFGTSASTIPNTTEIKKEPFVFNASSQSNNITPFIFKGNDASDNKASSGGFSFTAPNNNQLQNTNVFGTTSQQAPSNMFGSSPALFSTNSQPINNPAGTSPFTFGTPQSQQSSGIFNFTAPSQVPSSGTSTMGETFAFGIQKTTPQNTPSQVAPVPPTFDPNIKPNFNFSGGATPSFSAQGSTSLPAVKEVKERKIRKAVRRTLR